MRGLEFAGWYFAYREPLFPPRARWRVVDMGGGVAGLTLDASRRGAEGCNEEEPQIRLGAETETPFLPLDGVWVGV